MNIFFEHQHDSKALKHLRWFRSYYRQHTLKLLVSFLSGAIMGYWFLTSYSYYAISVDPALASVQLNLDGKESRLKVARYDNNATVVRMDLGQWGESLKDSVLFLTSLRDASSWGHGRSFVDHFALLASLHSETSSGSSSLGLLVSDPEEFKRISCWIGGHLFSSSVMSQQGLDCSGFSLTGWYQTKTIEKALRVVNFNHVTLIHKPHKQETVSREHRHDDSVQKERRRTIARYRNVLQALALRDEEALLWVDADIVQVPSDMLSRMLASKRDIIVPSCFRGGRSADNYYDRNTWVGPRAKPTPEERLALSQGKLYVPHNTPDTRFLTAFEHSGQEFVPVDSVGGTVLFMRGEVVRDGVNFPVFYVVGGEWEYEGYDGIETEGVCYVAKRLGYSCWGMPNVKIDHDDS
jgi:hypothetical protein